MFLRDEEFDTLESLCYCFDRDPMELQEYLSSEGYVYSKEQKQMRPKGYEGKSEITKDSIESAYCFMHQKYRVFEHSRMEWQKDDIEIAVSEYADGMNRELYDKIACGRKDFLRDHTTFGEDMRDAIEKLEQMLND